MLINNLLKEGNTNIALVSIKDLKEFAEEIIQQTKKEMEDLINFQQSEKYISRKRACEILDINECTIWRWKKKKYLQSIRVGGEDRYAMSEINKVLNIKI